jgi:ubiquinone/menaquinone biosynthesis C-methylase UbiE
MTSMDSQKKHAIDTHSSQSEEFASSYRDLAKDAYSSCFTYSRQRLAQHLGRFLPARGAGLQLLDVGCGTGHHVAQFREHGFAVSGVDGSPDMLAQARALNPTVDFRQADVDALPFADNTFDFIVCIEVLRYVPDPARCIGEMARVLKPGGCALVTAQPLLNLNGYFVVNRLPFKRLVGLVPLKQYFTTSGRLRRQFRAAGFASTDIHGVYLGPLNWVERLAPRLLRPVLRRWEHLDAALADRGGFREFANMFLVRAVKPG